MAEPARATPASAAARSPLALDSGEALRFLAAATVRDGQSRAALVMAMPPDNPPSGAVKVRPGAPDAADDLSAFLLRNKGANVYVHTGTVSPTFGGIRAKGAHIVGAASLATDFDPAADEKPEAAKVRIRGMLDRLEACGLGPDAIVDSGNGMQAHWWTGRLTFTADMPGADWVAWLKRLAAALGGDTNATDLARVLRLPGTVNHPGASKRAKGRVAVRSSLLTVRDYEPARRDLDSREAVDAFVSKIEAWGAANLGHTPSPVRGPSGAALEVDVSSLPPSYPADTVMSALRAIPNDEEHVPTRDGFVALLASFRAALGREAEGHRSAALDWATEHGWCPDEDYFDKAWCSLSAVRVGPGLLLDRAKQLGWKDGGRADFAGLPINDNDMPGGTAEPVRPTLVQGTDLAAMLDEFEQSVIRRGIGVFQRGGPVQVVNKRTRNRLGREVSYPAVHSLTPANVVDIASSHFAMRKLDRKGNEQPTSFSNQAAAAWLERGEWELPTLAAIAQSPIIGPDGAMVTACGFDPASGVYIDHDLALDQLPDPATWGTDDEARSAAREALDTLKEPLRFYCFEDPAGVSVALAAMLTPFVMHAGARPPVIAFDGTGPGVGKGKLVDVAAILATGGRAPAMTQGTNPQEFEKHLVGKLLAGASILNIDNVEQPLEGDLLNMLLTQERASLRPLGASRTVEVEARLFLLVTGNNMVVRGDMGRRVIVARINPGIERPELAEYPFDPAERALAERPALVAAALTVLVAHAARGFPGESMLKSRFGSFETWSRYVRAALVWLGEPDPLDTMKSLREADPVVAKLGAVLDAVEASIGTDVPFTVRTLLAAASGKDFEPDEGAKTLDAALGDALREELGGRYCTANPTNVGKYLKRHDGRVVNGLRLAQIKDDPKRGHSYRVTRASAPGLVGGMGGYGGVSASSPKKQNDEKDK